MKLQHLFTLNLFIAVFFGLSCAFMAGWVLQIYGLIPDEAALWTTRLVGGSILGYASLMWFGRRATSSDIRKAIAMALLIQDAVGLFASIILQLSGRANILSWSNPILYGLLALGYAYFLFIQPDAA
jgi:hypothetical protein